MNQRHWGPDPPPQLCSLLRPAQHTHHVVQRRHLGPGLKPKLPDVLCSTLLSGLCQVLRRARIPLTLLTLSGLHSKTAVAFCPLLSS